jgi:hypothetical protein
MSISAISSVSLYEYYYKINKEKEKKKESPLADEMRKYGLVPTDNEALNVQLLKNAKEAKKQETQQNEEIPHSQRPWADIMYQLNIQFNENPQDDIDDIKAELALLSKGMTDDELDQEIKDLENYIEKLYINFQQMHSPNISKTSSVNMHLNNLAMMNQISLF